MSDTLIVIPVRAGSVGIPGKAIQLLGDRSPLARTIDTAQTVDADLVVTSNDTVVLSSCVNLRIPICRQPPEVSGPDVPLDRPVHFAVTYMERLTYPKGYRTVVTMQCTSPFTTRETLVRAIQISQDGDNTTVWTVRDDRALRWESITPGMHTLSSRAPRRVTRQNMPSCFRETGALVVAPRRYVTPNSRLADLSYHIEVSGREAVDLDTMEDWWIAERYAKESDESRQLAAVR